MGGRGIGWDVLEFQKLKIKIHIQKLNKIKTQIKSETRDEVDLNAKRTRNYRRLADDGSKDPRMRKLRHLTIGRCGVGGLRKEDFLQFLAILRYCGVTMGCFSWPLLQRFASKN